MPALSTVVYQSVRRIPQANRAPQITLNSPQISAESNSPMRVSANVSGSSFNEVSFYAKTGKGGWITFVVSLFTTKVNIYEVHNNGNWYDLGFMLGVSSAFGSGGWAGTTGTRRSRNRTGG